MCKILSLVPRLIQAIWVGRMGWLPVQSPSIHVHHVKTKKKKTNQQQTKEVFISFTTCAANTTHLKNETQDKIQKRVLLQYCISAFTALQQKCDVGGYSHRNNCNCQSFSLC